MPKIIFILSVVMASIYWPTTASAQNKVVVVPLFDTSPTGVAAIPVYCPRTTVVPISSPLPAAIHSRIIDCFRSDNDARVDPVPNGHFLFVTDVRVTNNTVSHPSGASINIGRDNSGAQFPREPQFRIDSIFPRSDHIKFSTPYVVLRAGERLRVAHAGTPSGEAAVAVNVYTSGYLVKTDRFGG